MTTPIRISSPYIYHSLISPLATPPKLSVGLAAGYVFSRGSCAALLDPKLILITAAVARLLYSQTQTHSSKTNTRKCNSRERGSQFRQIHSTCVQCVDTLWRFRQQQRTWANYRHWSRPAGTADTFAKCPPLECIVDGEATLTSIWFAHAKRQCADSDFVIYFHLPREAVERSVG